MVRRCEKILGALITEPESIYLFDRGFIDFARLHRLTEAHAIYVTRTKRGVNWEHSTPGRWIGRRA